MCLSSLYRVAGTHIQLSVLLSEAVHSLALATYWSVMMNVHLCLSAARLTLMFSIFILLKAADGTASPASLHDDLMKKLVRPET